ncbi:hypothetical protein K7X08_001051 [Anisodus acutangulus]|uniref:Uncharacterized protein n=1 Tax=Anisodus acutangulus TaxID=402998 RepID=A0A9Q1RN44_9SOLA|nr:hypothetical protein K7X08_001051 [Anisodus acutangulus]
MDNPGIGWIMSVIKNSLALKPNQLVCRAQKHQEDNGNSVAVSRRLALTILIDAAAISYKVSPADAAYGESGVENFYLLM